MHGLLQHSSNRPQVPSPTGCMLYVNIRTRELLPNSPNTIRQPFNPRPHIDMHAMRRSAQGIAARSGGVSSELALDWLCLALEPSQLPLKFAQGAHSSSAAAGVRLVAAAVAAAEEPAGCDSPHINRNARFFRFYQRA